MDALNVKVLGLVDAGAQGSGPVGSLLESGPQGFRIACADGSVWLQRLQAPSGKPMAAQDFANGHPVGPATRFGRPGAEPQGGL